MDPECWICLNGPSCSLPLIQPCKCPRWVHKECLARWQLQSAGRREERCCRFCHEVLPEWRQPSDAGASAAAAGVAPTIALVVGGRVVMVRVDTSIIRCRQDFEVAVNTLLGLPPSTELHVNFAVKDPNSGALVNLAGMGTYDAAIYCAAQHATKRQHKRHYEGTAVPQAASSPSHLLSSQDQESQQTINHRPAARVAPAMLPRGSPSASGHEIAAEGVTRMPTSLSTSTHAASSSLPGAYGGVCSDPESAATQDGVRQIEPGSTSEAQGMSRASPLDHQKWPRWWFACN